MLDITNHQGNAKQNHDEMSSHTCQGGYHREEPASAGEAAEMRGCPRTVSWE